MTLKTPPEHRHPLFTKIKWLMFFRAVMVTLLLGAAGIVQTRASHLFPYSSSAHLYGLIAFTYFLTLIYAVLLPRIRNLRPFAYVQISIDILFVTFFIYLTGGIESIFSWVYIPVIIGASIILYRRGGLYAASASSILYGTLLDLEFYRIIPSSGPHFSPLSTTQSGYVFYLIAINIIAFYIVALLSAYLIGADPAERRGIKGPPHRLQSIGAAVQAYRPERTERPDHGGRGGAGDLV